MAVMVPLMLQAGKDAQSYRRAPPPDATPPAPSEAAPAVSRHLFHLVFLRSRSGIGALHGGTRSRAPNGAEGATRLWQFYHRSFGTTMPARTCPALGAYKAPSGGEGEFS